MNTLNIATHVFVSSLFFTAITGTFALIVFALKFLTGAN
jgi:hypothetical protein